MLDRDTQGDGLQADPRDIGPQLDLTALSVPERDPERIAFNLWNEGRVDEAIQFLERAIAAEKDRGGPPQEALPTLPLPVHAATDEIEPASGWRERHRAALSPAEFNAFGAPVHTIDLVAGPDDAIIPHPQRRSARPAWIVGLTLAVIGIFAAAAFWSGRAGAPAEAVLASVQPKAAEPAAPLPQSRPDNPTPQAVAAVPDDTDADVAIEEDPDATPDAVESESADVPPPDDGPAAEVASVSAGASPETTASIGPAPADTAAQNVTQPPVEEARLPRQRPEPPAGAISTASVEKPSVPVVYAPAPPPGYGPEPAEPFDPVNPRSTLTPAEYQALLERRAWATEYAARRRLIAERRARGEGAQGPVLLGEPGSFARYQQY